MLFDLRAFNLNESLNHVSKVRDFVSYFFSLSLHLGLILAQGK